MFLCKRVRSEVGVDSVGVGGGELGQGLLPVGGDPPRRRVCPWPCASGRACSSPWRAPRPGGPRCCRPAGHSSLTAASSEEIVAAVLGGPRGSVVQRLDRVGGAEVTRRRAGGKARKAVFLSQALSHVAAVWGYLRPGSDWRKAPGARRAASSSGAVQARAQGGGDPLAVPVGDEPHGWRGSGGPRRWGPWSRARTAPGGLGQAGRPVAAHDQHAPSTPLLAGPGAHMGPEGGPLPVLDPDP